MMTQTPQHPDPAVRALIGRLFDDVEPPHRPGMAEAAIAHGGAAVRRRGYLMAGATLGVVAVAAGAVAVGSRISGGGDDWSLRPGPVGTAAPAEFEDPHPSYSDKVREIETELPGLLGPLLPAGMTVRHDPSRGGPTTATGDVAPEFLLRSGPVEVVLQVDADPQGFTRPGGTPVPVEGGSFRLWTSSTAALYEKPGFTEWFEYTPADTAKPPVRFMIYGSGKNGPLDGAAFTKLLNAPGFHAVADLLDSSTPASAAAVRQRYQIEGRIDAETAGVLPPGYRLKLSPTQPDTLELVGPEGVDTFEWDYIGPGEMPAGRCLVDVLCFTGDNNDTVVMTPDGKPRLGVYAYTFGTADGARVFITVLGKPGLGESVDPAQHGKPDETAPQGPGLTPQQARAIVLTPGLAQTIADVRQATNL